MKLSRQSKINIAEQKFLNSIEHLWKLQYHFDLEFETKYVKTSAEVISPILSLLFNACFLSGIFPSCLKVAKVVPVFKSGDRTNLTNYRPIPILTCFSKTIKKLVHSRTMNFLNSNSLLCNA